MRALVLAIVFLGCQPATSVVPAPDAITFTAPESLVDWRFDIHGLPATDRRTGELLVADLGHGNIVRSLSLQVRTFGPPGKTMPILDDAESTHVLYDVEDDAEASRITRELAATVRGRVRAANRALAARALRPLAPCQVAETVFCSHPQKIVCGPTTFELDGDELSGVPTGWEIPPMDFGEGGPKKMLACIEEAHFDPATGRLAVRLDHVCEGGGTDVCILPDEWHVLATDPPGR